MNEWILNIVILLQKKIAIAAASFTISRIVRVQAYRGFGTTLGTRPMSGLKHLESNIR